MGVGFKVNVGKWAGASGRKGDWGGEAGRKAVKASRQKDSQRVYCCRRKM